MRILCLIVNIVAYFCILISLEVYIFMSNEIKIVCKTFDPYPVCALEGKRYKKLSYIIFLSYFIS